MGGRPDGVDGIPLAGDPSAPYHSIVSSAWAGGGLVSTTGDLATFLDALFAGHLVSEQACEEMTDNQPSGNGLGVFEVDLGSGRSGLGLNGWIGGYRSLMATDPTTGGTVIVHTNNDDIEPDRLAGWVTLGWRA